MINKRYILASKIGNKSIINRLRSFNIMKKIKRVLERVINYIGYSLIGYKEDIKWNESEIIKLRNDTRALEMSVTMARNDHVNLQDSFNRYVLRPKANEALKDANNIDIDKLVNDVYNSCNYGSYINKNDLKELINKHINLNN